MKLTVQVCMGLAVIAFVLGVPLLWGVPLGFLGAAAGGIHPGRAGPRAAGHRVLLHRPS